MKKKKNNPIFGDDGFRSEYGKGLMSKKNISSFSRSIANYIFLKKLNKYPLIIARDTRKSGEDIEKIIVTLVTKLGIDVTLAGVLPTPGLSKLIELHKYACGIMITASHNPASDNGIKLFSKSGYKMRLKEEKIIENGMREKIFIQKSSSVGTISHISNASKKYIDEIKNNLINISPKIKIAIDCANGAMVEPINQLFKGHLNCTIINNKPNGKNINNKCGALESSRLLKFIQKNRIDIGISFDGDGDRAIFVSRKYGVIESEKIFFLLSTNLFKNIKKDNIVVSEVFNYGTIISLRNYFNHVWITKAGDRNIIEKIRQKNSISGAEPSGHFNFPKISKSMDGLVTMIMFIKLVNKASFQLNKKLMKVQKYKRIIKNINIEKIEIDNQKLKKINKICLTNNERILVRISMWEPIIRIYYDYKLKNNFNLYHQKIISFLKII